jgi:hypothetical protein
MEWLATDFASRIRRGEHPTVAEYVARYPDYAAQIEELLPAVALLEQLRKREPSDTIFPAEHRSTSHCSGSLRDPTT